MNCIVSVAFRQPYLAHSKHQEEEIKGVDTIYYRDQLPHKDGVHTEDIVSHFQKSLYGFKPHAIQKARDLGYKKIVWFDPSTLPTCSVSVLFESLDRHPLIVRTGDHDIKDMCNQKSVKWFGLEPSDLEGHKHIGGTVYGFNFEDSITCEIFELWKKAEQEGIFGNQDEFMAGHWADEACLSLAMIVFGVDQYWESRFTYLNQKNL